MSKNFAPLPPSLSIILPLWLSQRYEEYTEDAKEKKGFFPLLQKKKKRLDR